MDGGDRKVRNIQVKKFGLPFGFEELAAYYNRGNTKQGDLYTVILLFIGPKSDNWLDLSLRMIMMMI